MYKLLSAITHAICQKLVSATAPILLIVPAGKVFGQNGYINSSFAVVEIPIWSKTGLVGKWTAGSSDKGLFSLVLGENGQGTFVVMTDKKIGENEYCRCKYTSKINFTWKAKKDSLILSFAKTSIDNGQSIASSDAQPHAQKLCEGVSCDIIKLATYAMTQELKGNYLRGTYILAENTLDFAGTEYKRE